MSDIFLKLLNMSFTASFLIVAILILRLVLQRAPKWAICALWALVAIRLVCPFSFESVLSLVPSANPIPEEIVYMEQPQIHSGIIMVDQTINPVISENLTPTPAESVNPMQIWLAVATLVWAVGVSVMLLYAVFTYLLLHRKVRASICTEDKIYICDDIDSPFILGIVRPRIFLPSGMEEATQQYVVAHEKAHLKRLDHLWKPFGFLLLSIYWFNPFIWIAYIMLCRDIELACDEKVIKDMGVEDKKEYSKALLTCNVSRRMIAACPLAFGEVGVKERVKSVLNYRKPSFWIVVIVFVAVIGVVVFFMTNPVSKEEPSGESDTKGAGTMTEESAPTDKDTPVENSNEASTTTPSYDIIYEKYTDTSELEVREAPDTADYTFEDRHFVCQDSTLNEVEYLIYSYYYFEAVGNFDKIMDLVGEDESFRNSVQNEKKQFEDGMYMSESIIHDLSTLTMEDMQQVSDSNKTYINREIEENELVEYVIVKVEVSWKYNAKRWYSSPQLPEGRYERYYLLGKTEDAGDFRIYEVFWEGLIPGETDASQLSVSQVMDRILTAIPLEEATPLTATADLPQGDQLYFLDATENGKYALYGFHSDEYQYTGLLINYKINGEDNWNYLDDIDNWIGYEFPKITESEDGGLFLSYCAMGGSGVHMDELLYFKPYETGTLERYKLNNQEMMEQIKELVSIKVDRNAREVQFYDLEGGQEELFALRPCPDSLDGQMFKIKNARCYYEQTQFIFDPNMVIVGVGIFTEDSLMPIHIGQLAFRIRMEETGDGMQFKLYDVSTYESGGVKEY